MKQAIPSPYSKNFKLRMMIGERGIKKPKEKLNLKTGTFISFYFDATFI
jgi:hypothetical protein